MNNFFGNLAKSRLPTILLLSIMYYVGLDLINSGDILSIEGTTGIIILCAAGILTVVAFLDYRNREANSAALEQMENAVDSLSKALKASSSATVTSEKVREQILKSQKEE